jgi:hypothetical protein
VAAAFVRTNLAATAAVTNAASITTAGLTTGTNAGSLLLCPCASRLGAAHGLSSVSGGGLTWQQAFSWAGLSTNGVSLFWAYCDTPVAAGTTFTLTKGVAGARWVYSFHEFSGLSPYGPDLSVNNVAANGSTGAPTQTTQGKVPGGALVFAATEQNASATTALATPSAGFTEVGDLVAGTATWCHGYFQYEVTATNFTPATVTAAGTYVETTDSWIGGLAVFPSIAPRPPMRRFAPAMANAGGFR